MSNTTIEPSSYNIYLLGNKGKAFQKPRLDWKENPGVQKLLDAISSIIAAEYIEIAKQNRDVFFEIASGTSCSRNDQQANGGKK